MINKISFLFIVLMFFAANCSGLDIKQNEYDLMEEKLETEGINLPPSDKGFGKGFSIADLLPSSGGSFDTVDEITFGVALDKLSFMPLASVDAASGVIITDWYNIQNDNLRIKINVRIIDAELNNNSIMVQLFKQEYDGSKWNDTGIDVDQSQKIKQSILIDAQKLKVTLDLN